VIYQLTEEIEQALVGMLSPVETEAIIGEVEVRALFKVSRLGTIAGSMVTSGVVRRGASIRIFREGTRIHETTVAALRRFKDNVRNRVGASVSEVDHHDLWQRATLVVACAARSAHDAEQLAETAERWLASGDWVLARCDRLLISPED